MSDRPQTRPKRRQIKSNAWRWSTTSNHPDALGDAPIVGLSLGRSGSHASPRQPGSTPRVLARPFPTSPTAVPTSASDLTQCRASSASADRTMLSVPTTRPPAATKAAPVLSPAVVTKPCRPYTPLLVLKTNRTQIEHDSQPVAAMIHGSCQQSGPEAQSKTVRAAAAYSPSGHLGLLPCAQHLALPLLTGEPVTRPLTSLLSHTTGYCPMLGHRAKTCSPSRKRPGPRISVSAAATSVAAAAAQGTTAQLGTDRPPGPEDDPACRTRARLLAYWQWHSSSAPIATAPPAPPAPARGT